MNVVSLCGQGCKQDTPCLDLIPGPIYEATLISYEEEFNAEPFAWRTVSSE